MNDSRLVTGVDEVGRGSFAGPLMAAAVIIPEGVELPGVKDSKKMTPLQRERAYDLICERCTVAVGAVCVLTIDKIGLLKATLLAMKRAVHNLSVRPDYVLVDGNYYIDDIDIPGEAVVRGDSKHLSISAASIIAKVTRDRLMVNLDRIYPDYGFVRNKGYGTFEHHRALTKFGPTPHHRFRFEPVRQCQLALNVHRSK